LIGKKNSPEAGAQLHEPFSRISAPRALPVVPENSIRDVRAIGAQSNGAPWRVGIRHPREDGRTIASVELVDGAVATSGDYERFFEIGGRRYCHILDPRSGMPVAHWQSVSVVAPLCIVAGSCSTMAMLMGAAGAAFLAQQGLSYIAVAPDGSLRRPETSAP
jgi:thiamine biosynthesis lipoprotein